MKCVCGYEYVRDHWDPEENPNIGDREFIRIQGDLSRSVELNYGGSEMQQVIIYACPKCGTLKMY